MPSGSSLGSTFLHVQEFGRGGYAKLPSLLALSGKVTVWAPSGEIIRREHNLGRLPFSSLEFLKAVDDGKLQVAARHDWIMSKNSRNTGFWTNAPWLDGFDDTLRKWAREDSNIQDVTLRRVVGLEMGAGYEYARQAIQTKDEVLNRVAIHIDLKNISQGIMSAAYEHYKNDKRKEMDEAEYLKYFILAWAYNHSEAQVKLRAKIAASSKSQMIYFQDIIRDEEAKIEIERVPQFTESFDFLKSEYVEEIFYFIGHLYSKKRKSALLGLNNDAHFRFLRELALNPNAPPVLRLEAELSASVDALSPNSSAGTIRRPKLDRYAASIQRAVTTLSGYVSPAILKWKLWSNLNLTPVPRYKNHWAFLMVGKRTPRKKDLEKMLLWIEEFKKTRSRI
jgi:hypothetical protein